MRGSEISADTVGLDSEIPCEKLSLRQRFWYGLRGLIGLDAPGVFISRSECGFFLLDIKGVPHRYLASAIRLQLSQLGVAHEPGFAYRLDKQMAQVWCWDESLLLGQAQKSMCPLPEPLLRPYETVGTSKLRIVACIAGYEAEFREGDCLRKSRWFEVLPTEEQWSAFCRDAGQLVVPRPEPQMLPRESVVAKGWKIQSKLGLSWGLVQWVTAAACAVLGAVGVAQGAVWLRLDLALQHERATLQTLRVERGAILALQQGVEKHSAYVNGIYKSLPAHGQLELFRELYEAQVVGKEAGVSLASWNYQNGQLIMGFVLNDRDLSQRVFLSRLQKLPSFTRIRLPANIKPGPLVVHAAVRDSAQIQADNVQKEGL